MATATLTTGEAAKALGVSPETVRRLADRGILPHARLTPLPGSPRRIEADAVEGLLERTRRSS